ncbi:CotH kinase family protein [Candidatus Saccharibacteria bacterium]|nr:CotH kinase family protein [Candidatus Saccharibacteria bacterium]
MSRRRGGRRLGAGVFIGLCAILFLIIVLIVCALAFHKIEHKVEKREMPMIELSLEDGVTLEMVNAPDKTNFVRNELVLHAWGDNKKWSNVEIKGRGNTSWLEPKKSYRIKFDKKTDFLGMNKIRKWAFLAYWSDESMLRPDLGYYFARLINPDFCLDGRYAELLINGENMGLYYVSPKVAIDKKIVDLREPLGIIVEGDMAWQDDEFMSNHGVRFSVEDSVNYDLLSEAKNDFKTAFDELEEAVYNGDFDALKKIADIESFAEYFLLSEFIQNYDAYVSSFYFYKDGMNDVIHAGPAWDFDGAFDNRNWQVRNEERRERPDLLFAIWAKEKTPGEVELIAPYYNSLSLLMYKLFEMPEFQDVVKKMYIERLSDKRNVALSYIEDKTNYIRDAVRRNNELWGLGDFEDEVNYIQWWVERRFDAFDEYFDLEISSKWNREIEL